MLATNNHGALNSASLRQFSDRVAAAATSGSTIVALARKMPRLLESLGMPAERGIVVTERALPWLAAASLRSSPPTFCDDVLNVGTTLDHYAQYAERRFGTTPRIVVYAQRMPAKRTLPKSPLGKYEVDVQEEFSDEAYWRFETALPQELLRGGKPYDIDFPVIEIPLSVVAASRRPAEWYEILSSRFAHVHSLTTPTQAEAGICSFTVLAPASAAPLVIPGRRHTPPGKLRLYISREQKLIRVVPILIPSLTGADLSNSAYLPEPVRALYETLCERAAPADPFPREPLYNLFVYLVSFEYGRQALRDVAACADIDGTGRSSVSLRDLQFIFGPTVGVELRDALNSLLRQPALNAGGDSSQVPEDETLAPAKPQLVAAIVSELRRRSFHGESAARVFRETFRILAELTGATDGVDARTGFPAYERLRKGLALADLCAVVGAISDPAPSTEHLSFLLDYYIDIGAVVPVVEVIDGDVYLRTYRRGEADPIELAQFLHALLAEHEQMSPQSPLTKTEFTKILSALAIFHRGRIPLEPVFEFRGMVPFVAPDSVVVSQSEEAIQFLQRLGYMSLDSATDDRDTEQGRLFV